MIELRDVSFSYDGEKNVLERVSLSLRPGERTVVLGTNGSGKSTLARLLNGSLRPGSGLVTVDGERDRLARLVGYVRQDPRNQIVSAVVSDEVAFGPRNLGLARDEVRERVDEALAACGIEALRDRMTSELSGGQQQLVALAGVLAMRPRYIVLDEARSMLDQATRSRVGDIVRRLTGAGAGVVEISHDAEALLGAARALVVDGGRVVWDGTPGELLTSGTTAAIAGLGHDELAGVLARAAAVGVGIGEYPGVAELAPFAGEGIVVPTGAVPVDGATLEARGVSLLFGELTALRDVTLEARGVTLVLGPSGCGKTSLARVLAGVLDPDGGAALLDGSTVRAGMVGLAFQRPEDQVFCETVYDEVAYGPRAQGWPEDRVRGEVERAMRLLGVDEGLWGRSPFELSGGQMRRVALAGVVSARPGAYVLDEPTAGLDAASRADLRSLVRSLAGEGASVVVVTHDVGEWLGEASSVVFLRKGRVVACALPGDVAGDPAAFSAAGLEAPLVVRLRAAVGEGMRADA